jgi:hypothetical protein
MREFDDLSLGSLRFESFQVHNRALTPQPPQGFVHGDAGKPCRKAGVAANPAQTGKGGDIRFLDHIFGFAVIPQNAARNPIKSAIVPLHDGTKCRVVTGEGAPYEFGIAGRDGNMASPAKLPMST